MAKTAPQLTYDPARLVALQSALIEARASFRGKRERLHELRAEHDDLRRTAMTRASRESDYPGARDEAAKATDTATKRADAALARVNSASVELSEAHAAVGAARAALAAALKFADGQGIETPAEIDRREVLE